MTRLISLGVAGTLLLQPPVELWAASARPAETRKAGSFAPAPPLVRPVRPFRMASTIETLPTASAPAAGAAPIGTVPVRTSPVRACEGELAELTLRYTGAGGPAHVQVVSEERAAEPLFEETLSPSDTVTLRIPELEGGARALRLLVNGSISGTIDTTCGDWARPGIVVGQFEVVRSLVSQAGSIAALGRDDLRVRLAVVLAEDAGAPGVGPGDFLRYTALVENRTAVSLGGLVYLNPPIAHTRLVNGSVTTTQGAVAAGNGAGDTLVKVAIGTLARHASAQVTFEVAVDDNLPADLVHVAAQGLAFGDQAPGTLSDDKRTVRAHDPTRMVTGIQPWLDADETATLCSRGARCVPGSPGDGPLVHYVVTVANSGNAEAQGAVFTDSPSAHTALVAGSVQTSRGTVTSGNDGSDTSVAVDVGRLRPGATARISFDVAVDAPVEVTSVENQGLVVWSGNPGGQPTDDPETMATRDPTRVALGDGAFLYATKTDFLAADMDGDGLVGAGDTLRYVVSVGNLGNRKAKQSGFSDTPDPATTLVVGSVATSQGTVTAGNQAGDSSVEVTLGDLKGWRGPVTIAFEATINPAPGVPRVSNQGHATAPGLEGMATDDPDTAIVGDPTITPLATGTNEATLGGVVWDDSDADGVREAGEPPLGAVTVNLLDSSSSVVATTTTAGDGAYAFGGLAAGTYMAEFVAPSGYGFSPKDQGADDQLDSDADPATGRTAPVALAAGESNLTRDAGLHRSATVGDFVWHDLNGNGVQDGGEPGVGGVALSLLNGAGQTVAATVSNADGSYLFAGVAPGNYVVAATPPGGYFFTPADQGGNDDADSDVDPATGRSGLQTVVAGGAANVDVGLYQPATIGDYVWRDVDNNGVQGVDEIGFEGVTVKLLDADRAELQTAVTDAAGHYHFAGLRPGTYAVEFVPPPSYALTTPDVGDDLGDSDADPASHRTAPFALGSGQALPFVDAGLYTPPAHVTSSPMNGDVDVAVTRETILRFSNPLADSAVMDDTVVFAEFAGERLAVRINVAPDRRTVTLFYDEELPPSARIRVTLVGDGLLDVYGTPVDADGDGAPGGVGHIDFDTLTLTTLEGTAVCGRVFASQLAPGDDHGSVNTPLEGVIVTVDGATETLRAVTDGQGNFCLDPAPVGSFFVHIDGRAAVNPVPMGDYYPFVGKLWQSTAGKTTNIGEIYLPRVAAGTLQPVSRTAETPVTFPTSVLAEFPEFAGTEVRIPADALYSDDGSRGGMVGIAPVPPDRLPGPPPAGLEFPLVITVQTDGPSNFAQPVPVCFPNLPDPGLGVPLDPGTANGLYAYNHDTGEWQYVGPMTVTADGQSICTDPGTGLLAPGWVGTAPPPTQPPPPPTPPQRKCPPTPAGDPCFDYYESRAADCEADHKAHLALEATEQGTLLVECVAGTLELGPLGPLGCLLAIEAQSIAFSRLLDKFFDQCMEEASKQFDECLDFYFNCSVFVSGRPGAAAADQIIRAAAGTPAPAPQLAPIVDPEADPVVQLIRQFEAAVAPFNHPGGQLTPEVIDQVRDITAQARTAAGGDIGSYLRTLSRGIESHMPPIGAPTLPAAGNAPAYPIQYAAMVHGPHGIFMVRGKTSPLGQYTLFLGRNTALQSVSYYDPRTRSYGADYPRVSPGPYRLGRPNLVPVDPAAPDSDHDGAPDVVEEVYGTDYLNADSDGDGVPDGPEIDQGTDPLDGQPAATGIIATAATPGPAIDVCAVNDRVVVADRGVGITVFNVFNGMKPTVVAQVSVPGTSEAVACAGDLVAVAGGTSGLYIVDVSDPPAAHIVRRVELPRGAQEVAVAGNLAYVASGSEVALIDLPSGAILDRRGYTGGTMHDIAIAGDAAYVLAVTIPTSHTVHKLRIGPHLADPVSSLLITDHPTFGRMHIAAGDGLVYLGSEDDTWAAQVPGVGILRDSETTGLSMIGVPSPITAFDVEPNGSGLALFTGADTSLTSNAKVAVLDVSDPTRTDRLLFAMETPGSATAISIYNGLAYVADNTGGLQVVNYLPYDRNGLPPTISLSSNFAPGLAEEGHLMRVTAHVTDDVQVRNVEFYVDGVKRLTDGNFPFEHRFVTPRTQDQPTFTLHACATDTGGNRTCTADDTITLTADATPPAVLAVSPKAGSRAGGVSAVTASFSEPIDPATLAVGGAFTLISAGPDDVLGTPDDQPVAGGVISYRPATNSVVATFPATLSFGNYRAALGPAIADLTGNLLGAEFAWTFRVKTPPTISILSPTTGFTFTSGTVVGVFASAHDEVGVESVTFMVDGVEKATDLTAPYTYSLTIPTVTAPTPITLDAAVEDVGGGSAQASPVTIMAIPDPLPTVVLTYPGPADHVTGGETITLRANASDNVRVVAVRFLVDGNLVATVPSLPYQASYHVPVGVSSIHVVAEAVDNLDQVSTSARDVPVVPETPPTVALVQPPAGAVLMEGSIVTVEATASDNGQVTQVRFTADGQPIGTDTVAPYRASFTVALGATSVTIAAEATDNIGQTTTVSEAHAAVADPPPTLQLVAPGEGTSVTEGDSVLFQAMATDNVRVAQVRFVVGAQDVVDFTEPFEARVTVPFGISTLPVVIEAQDNLGRTTTLTPAPYPVLTQAARLFVEPAGLSFFLPAKPAGPIGPIVAPGTAGARRPAGRSPAIRKTPSMRRPSSPGASIPVGRGAPTADAVHLPLHFEPRPESGGGFVARGPGYAAALGPSGVSLAAAGADAAQAVSPLGLTFVGANPDPRIEGLEPLAGVSHYLRGTDRAAWRHDVPHYGRVRYQGVYPGVDFVFYGRGRELEYDIVLQPGADPDAVTLAVAGVDGVRIDANGDLLLGGPTGFRQLKPVVYQEAEGGRRAVEAGYVLRGGNRIGFHVEGYDRREPLFIDPVLRFSSYLGGSSLEAPTSIKIDAGGYIYLAGTTYSTDFPVKNPLQGISGFSLDSFITKITPDGTSVVYSTYLGGNGVDNVARIDVDSEGRVYLAGSTTSSDFPTYNAFQAVGGVCGGFCTDAFVAALDASGSSFVFSTYLGGSNNEAAGGVAVDGAGNVRVAGWTRSDSFPGSNIRFLSVFDRSDVFLTTFTRTGAFVSTRTFGGSYTEGASDVAVDPSGAIYLTGFYNSGGAPPFSSGVFGPYHGGCFGFSYPVCGDTFVLKLAPSGGLAYTAYLGGDGDDLSRAIVADADGNAYVGGTTESGGIALTNPIQTTGNGFVEKLDATGQVVFSTRYGGAVNGVAVDADRNVYLTGIASDIPLVNAMQDSSNSTDTFVAEIEASGASFVYSTPLGGPGYDAGYAIAVDGSGNAYVAGQTSGNFPIVGAAFQPAPGSPFAYDAYVARIGRADSVNFGVAQYAVSEDAGQVEVAIVRSDAAPDVPVTVAYATINGSATGFFDYTPASGTVTFEPGDTRHTVTIPILNDDLVEGEETFDLSLAVVDAGSSVIVGHQATTTVRIQDVDFTPPVGTATQTFVVRDRVRANGPSWEASADVPWLTIEPTSGVGPTQVAVTADSAGLEAGSYVGVVTVTAAAQDSPQQVFVALEVGTHFATSPESLSLASDAPSATGQISLVAGGGSGGDGGPAVDASLTPTTAIAVDGAGNLYIADHDAFRVRKVAPDGIITTVAGNGTQGNSGDGGPATEAQVDSVNGLATDAAGNLFISDMAQHRVRKVGLDGIIIAVAGTGAAGFSGDGGPAIDAELSSPVGLTVDSSGNLLIADAGNNRVRRVDAGGTITTVAGNGEASYAGDGGPATEAALNFPVAVAVGPEGTTYIADVGNHLVRRVAGGTMYTFAGGTRDFCHFSIGPGFGGDGIPAYGSALNEPSGVAVNARGEVFIADTQNQRIRKVVGGGIYTVAGTGTAGYSGDGGSGAGAELAAPWSVATDAAGNVWIADTANSRVRRLGGAATWLATPFDVMGTDGWTLGDWQATADAPWLAVVPALGTGDTFGVHAVADTAGMAPGVHAAAIIVATDQGLVSHALPVSVTVLPPGLGVEPSAFQLYGRADYAPTVSASIRIFDSVDPSGPVNWTLSTDVSWLTLSQESGTGPAEVTLTADLWGFFDDVGVATITLSAEGVETPREVRVTITVDRCGE